MNIGLTYDLRSDWLAAGYSPQETAEFDSERTIEAIEEALRALGHRPSRIGRLDALIERLALGPPLACDLVFNICEGMHGIGREAQVPAILDAFRVPYTFSDPLVMALTLHKAMTKRVVRDMGLPTPAFSVVSAPADVEVALAQLSLPIFVKPLAEGTSKGVTPRSLCTSAAQFREAAADLLARFAQPVLAEVFLPGREVTVGVVGTGVRARAVGTLEVRIRPGVEDGVYSYDLKQDFEGKLEYVLAPAELSAEAEALALSAWRGLGCRDAGRVDLKQDAAGRLSFLEVNPLAGLHP
ncbi:MAG: D-alanine--D-alanine ligase, partial [Planctomycetota bacterium]|nr:D-alanine--D-alanine ligase [Planctomycetota bacterium]